MSAPELLTPDEFHKRVGFPVPDGVIRNLQEVQARPLLSGEEFFDSDESCYNCHGEGGFHNCGEDCCCCLDKEEITEICPVCGGTGDLPPDTTRPLDEPRCVAGCHLDIHTSVMWHSPGCPHLPLLEPDPEQLELLTSPDQEPDDER